MKKIFILAVIIFIVITSAYNTRADSGIGFFIGLSTPNDQINDVYNSDKLADISTGNLYREGASTGFDIGVKLRMPVNGNIIFTGAVSWNRFPQSRIKVKDPTNSDGPALATLITSQNIVPVAAGINFYPFKSRVAIYGAADVTYNYLYNSVELDGGSDFNLSNTSPSYNRIGAGLGAGIDIDIELLVLNLELKYNFANLIGKTDDEKAKNYLTLNIGVFFGGSNSSDDDTEI